YDETEWLYRGYTEHEHIQELGGILNINERMYDPITGQMLAPDNYVSLPHRLSGYNRYLYADGNPLKYTDPSGNLTQSQMEEVEDAIDKMRNGNYNGNGERWYDYDGRTGHYSFGSQGQAFGYGVSYMNSYGSWGMHPGWAGSTREALGRYGRYTGSYGLTDDMWNGYMQFQWSGYAYDISTINSSSSKYGAGFTTTGLTFANANLGGAVTTFYSYGKAEGMFLGSGDINKTLNKVGVTLGVISDVYILKRDINKLPSWFRGGYKSIHMPGSKPYTSFTSLGLRRIGWQYGGRVLQTRGTALAYGTMIYDNISYYDQIISSEGKTANEIKEHYDDVFQNPMMWMYNKLGVEGWLIDRLGN